MERRRYFLTLSYLGTAYAGWQRQPRQRTLQAVVEEALSTLLGEQVSVAGSGRTDAGVHALGQVAHFEAAAAPPEAFLRRLNSLLPPDVAAAALQPVRATAHARCDAVLRRYVYRLHGVKRPLLAAHSYYCPYPLDLAAMQQAARLYLRYTDFRAFARAGSRPGHYRCLLRQASWHTEGEELVFSVTANRFLRGMVRAMVGTCTEVGRHRLQVAQISDILQAQARPAAGPSAPAHGLCLVSVQYSPSVYAYEHPPD